MKFLCVECDEQMRLTGTKGPDRGSMTVLFECTSCGKRTAMLTNAMETQMVSSLGVSIGGRASRPEPMEMLRSTLLVEEGDGAEAGNAGTAGTAHSGGSAGASPGASPSMSADDRTSAGDGASKCPFTGTVNEALSTGDLEWTDEARERMERIPSFVRPMVQRGIEDHARAKGLRRIDRDVLDAVRKDIGM